MKNKYRKTLFLTPLALMVVGTAVNAGEIKPMAAPAPAAPSPTEDVISGILKLDFNSHFVSYGLDVWSDGSKMSETGFNPNLELYIALPANLTLTIGTWMDVNSKIANSDGVTDSPLGGRIQEVDAYVGLSYAIDKFSVGVTYQAWMYGSDTENILDVKFAYDCFLAPSLTVHNRLEQGAASGDEGTILVLGLSHSVEAGPVTFSFPFNLAYFLTEDYHNFPVKGGSDKGFGYLSIGASASLPLTPYIGDGFGEWALNGGVTYFFTDDEIIPNNPKSNFLTASVGLSVAF